MRIGIGLPFENPRKVRKTWSFVLRQTFLNRTGAIEITGTE